MKLLLLIIVLTTSIFSFVDNTHQNLPEDAILFMEKEGSNQQRWAVDYLKSKAGGRYVDSSDNRGNSVQTGSGTSIQYSPEFGDMYGNGGDKVAIPTPIASTPKSNNCFQIDDFAVYKSPSEGPFVGIGCGIIGIARAGGVAPDYFRDTFWWDTATSGWKYTAPDFTKIGDLNYSSAFHFINLVNRNYENKELVNNNYNDFDGYAYNAAFGFPGFGKDYGVAIFFNNAWMTVDIVNCTECNMEGGRYTIYPGVNPATSYKQNGSQTPVGSPSNDGQKVGSGSLTNYNCYSDMRGNACPDEGQKVGDYYQIPNISDQGWTVSSDMDWVIYEPADNASTYFYNEWFLEGGNSSTGNNLYSLQTSAVSGRYYSIDAPSLRGMAVVMHWIGDINQPMHVWSSLGYNHSDYEAFADKFYGRRTPLGSDTSKNYENFSYDAKAFFNSRIKRYYDGIDDLFMENAWMTYNTRKRGDHDVMNQTDDATRSNMLRWSVNSAIAQISLVYEKGVMDLRLCRNGCPASVNNPYSNTLRGRSTPSGLYQLRY